MHMGYRFHSPLARRDERNKLDVLFYFLKARPNLLPWTYLHESLDLSLWYNGSTFALLADTEQND